MDEALYWSQPTTEATQHSAKTRGVTHIVGALLVPADYGCCAIFGWAQCSDLYNHHTVRPGRPRLQ